jgi:putative transposase
MPNHVHGILIFNNPDYNQWQPNLFGVQSKNLGSVIRGYKASVTKYATTHSLEFLWQSRYYDHVIRDEDELNRIRQYIINNVRKWKEDMNNPENIFM